MVYPVIIPLFTVFHRNHDSYQRQDFATVSLKSDQQIYEIEHLAVCQNLVPLVNIKIAGKWMVIPLKMVLIGIDPYPSIWIAGNYFDHHQVSEKNAYGCRPLRWTCRNSPRWGYCYSHRIGWDNLPEKPIFGGKNPGFRLTFSLKPIH